jgi:hypothetical protein
VAWEFGREQGFAGSLSLFFFNLESACCCNWFDVICLIWVDVRFLEGESFVIIWG